jgi:lipopolysaccharide export LptBFGC system permease protein LptF
MRILSRYILREILAPSLLAFAIICFLGVANELRERSDALPVGYLGAFDLVRLAWYFLPTLIYVILPVTWLMGILLAFGRLSGQNEVTAMRAAGIPLKRVVLPVIVAGAGLSVFCYVLQDRAQPYAMRAVKRFFHQELAERVTLESLAPGVSHAFEDWRVYIGARDEDGSLRRVSVEAPRGDGAPWIYYADRLRVDRRGGRPVAVFEDGYRLSAERGGATLLSRFNRIEQPLPQTPSIDRPLSRKEMTVEQLWSFARRLRADEAGTGEIERELNKVYGELNDRVALPLACLAVSLLAAPLAVRNREAGRSGSFAIGLGVALAYYVLYYGSKAIVDSGLLASLPGALAAGLLPNIIMGAAGVYAVWRVDRV